MRLAVLAALVLSTAPLAAETVLTAKGFEKMSTGKTLFFSRAGEPYGAEQYMPGRQVIWQYSDGSCANGYWYEQDQSLCFVYDDNPRAQCWVFTRRAQDFFVRVVGQSAGNPDELRMTGESDAPLNCTAPDLGV